MQCHQQNCSCGQGSTTAEAANRSSHGEVEEGEVVRVVGRLQAAEGGIAQISLHPSSAIKGLQQVVQVDVLVHNAILMHVAQP